MISGPNQQTNFASYGICHSWSHALMLQIRLLRLLILAWKVALSYLKSKYTFQLRIGSPSLSARS